MTLFTTQINGIDYLGDKINDKRPKFLCLLRMICDMSVIAYYLQENLL